jgi:hypothetical protein
MKTIIEFIINHWQAGIGISGLLYELIARFKPTKKNWSIISKVSNAIDIIIPNLEKGPDGKIRFKRILKVIVLMILFSQDVVAQNPNNQFKAIYGTNASDSAFIQSTRASLQLANGNTGVIWFDEVQNKWRVWDGDEYVDLIQSGGGGAFWPLDGLGEVTGDVYIHPDVNATKTIIIGSNSDESLVANTVVIRSTAGSSFNSLGGVSISGDLDVNIASGNALALSATDLNINTVDDVNITSSGFGVSDSEFSYTRGGPVTFTGSSIGLTSSVGPIDMTSQNGTVTITSGGGAGDNVNIVSDVNNVNITAGTAFGVTTIDAAINAADDLTLSGNGGVIVAATGSTVTIQGTPVIDNPADNNALTTLLGRNSGTGIIEERTVASIAGTPAGATTQVQYNNAGAFGAEAAFTYNSGTDVLTASLLTLNAGVLARTSTAADVDIASGSNTRFLDSDNTTNRTIFVAPWVVSGSNSEILSARISAIAADDFTIRAGNGVTSATANIAAGDNIVIQAGNGAGASNGNGGNVTITPGTLSGTGTRGYFIISNIPTSSAGLPSGAVWSNAGVLTIVP